MRMLKETSRTFYIPITTLPKSLKTSVAAAYLCFRAIDEIEDHPDLPAHEKMCLLRNIGRILQVATPAVSPRLEALFAPYNGQLPEVTVRLAEWSRLPEPSMSPRIRDAVATMADRMADWTERNWDIQTEDDLSGYTYSVAGAIGLLLSDLWSWHDGVQTDREGAVAYGRGLQTVNIIRNRNEDLARGVDFFPSGWGQTQMIAYCRTHLQQADQYNRSLNGHAARHFCLIPLALAKATLGAIEDGREKLSRADVGTVVAQILKQ